MNANERLPTGLGFRPSGLTQRKQTLNCCARKNSSRGSNNPANPRAAIRVDSMITNSLGNIFQNKVAKDPIYQVLLDRHSDMDMHTLADDLREFAKNIGASGRSE